MKTYRNRWRARRGVAIAFGLVAVAAVLTGYVALAGEPDRVVAGRLPAIFSRIDQNLSNPATARRASERVQARIKFNLTGPGGGVWVLDLEDAPGLHRGDGPADAAVTMSAANFVRMVEGESDAIVLYFTARMGIDGDIDALTRLGAVESIF